MMVMNWKKYILQAVVAGVLASAACIIYMNIYKEALGANYEKIINPVAITGSCIFGCLLMGIGYALLHRFDKVKYTGLLNVMIAVLSFASIIGPISMTLPLDTANPELFPGLVVPMHFFPALAFFTIAPFFSLTYKYK
jgi:hypothetical protein